MGRTKQQKEKTKETENKKKKLKLKSKPKPSPKPTPNLLTLAEKISVINEYEKVGNVRKLSKMYFCSRAQIRNIWRRKNEYLMEWNDKSVKESTIPEKTVVLDEVVREWARRSRNRSISDAKLSETASAIAKLMKIKYFRMSETWKTRIKKIINKDKKQPISVKDSEESKKSLKLADILFDVKETYKVAEDSTGKLDKNARAVEESDDTTLEESDFEGFEETSENNEVVQESTTDLIEMEIEDSQEEETFEYPISIVIKEEEKTMENSIEVIEITHNEAAIVSVKEEQIDVPVKHEQLSEDEDISSYEEALYYLESLGDFVLVKEDFRALEVINQLENWFSEQMRLNL